MSRPEPMTLDEALPRWHRRERHRLPVDLPAPAVIRAAAEVTWGEVPLFRAVMTAAGLGRTRLPADTPVLDLFLGNGFAVLYRGEDELLVGGIERVSRNRPVVPLAPGTTPEVFHAFDAPGHLKLAVNFHCAGGVLSTETRVYATDRRSRWLFGAYWLVIRAGSGFIRRVWLRGVRRRAARTGRDVGPASRV
ncbi:hypothetical protein ACIBCT_08760 [Streptosporangium sp. NPDC050855]|uniref:hypothetical protein n=1 Tax=Streptosporangium sp. NPDC050855 TaxID=3366194 RepID=UPI00379323C3